jgi:hypothetical protein
VAHHRGKAAKRCLAGQVKVLGRAEQVKVRYESRRNGALSYIEYDHSKCKPKTLRSKGVGTSRITAAGFSDVDVTECSQQKASGSRTQGVRQNNFYQNRQHLSRLPDHG